MIPPKLPGPIELGPYLEKLDRHPGSVILVAIEQPEVCNFTRCTWAWLSREERKAMRRALEATRKRREQSMQQNTTPAEPPSGPVPNPKPDPRIPDVWRPKR